MHKFYCMIWSVRSLFKNIRKGKWKAIFRMFYDKNYRDDIKYMLQVVRERPVKLVESEIPLNLIKSSHEINYWDWVIELRLRIRINGYLSLEPIKIIWDDVELKYLIVDGNHRFAALKKELSPYHKIPVQVLVPKEAV